MSLDGTQDNMPSLQPYLKTLIGGFCVALTIVLWALCIWQVILRFAPDMTPSEKPPCFCQHNGICPDGLCLCPEDWIGSYCEIVNFCDKSTYVVNASQYNLAFEKIIVGKYGYSMEKCDNGTVNAGAPKATRMCTRKNGVPVLEPPSAVNCNVTLVGLSEKIQSVNETTPTDIVNIATDTQILTSSPEQLNSTDISIAASIAEKILNLSDSNVPGEEFLL
ncbi:adhesion G-protein coupled receptor G7-like [Eublepharis macularius]|uniref:Adhesion G-protein coupled receptor G7-like n=1 Tax=Eublepharis macularius TaxID=481883 RepID=A0AA97J2U2_EUBMA|nr:adhesion G-protein coupled receptor G7-like [Eublepharis macularius]